MLMQNLQQERLVVAIGAQANAEQVLEDAIRVQRFLPLQSG